MLPRLSQQFQVVAVDLLGHGRSPKPTQHYGLDVVVRSVMDWWEEQGLGPPHLAGLSMGGAVAVRWAELEPDRVRSLTLVAPGGFGGPKDPRMHLIGVPILGPLLFRGKEATIRKFWSKACLDPALLTEEFLQAEIAHAQDPDCRRVLFSILRRFPRSGLSLWRELKTIRCPTQILWGREDPVISCKQGKLAAKLIPGARLVIVDRCGHIMPWEQPDRLQAEILAFLGAAGQAQAP